MYKHQPEPQVPQITYGHSKDRRPDLKQLLFGVGISGDGLLLLAEVSSDNQSDMIFNGHWIQQLREQLALTPEEFLLYVADSAVVTMGNLGLLREHNIGLLSCLSETLMAQAQGALDSLEGGGCSPLGRCLEGATNLSSISPSQAPIARTSESLMPS